MRLTKREILNWIFNCRKKDDFRFGFVKDIFDFYMYGNLIRVFKVSHEKFLIKVLNNATSKQLFLAVVSDKDNCRMLNEKMKLWRQTNL